MPRGSAARRGRYAYAAENVKTLRGRRCWDVPAAGGGLCADLESSALVRLGNGWLAGIVIVDPQVPGDQINNLRRLSVPGHFRSKPAVAWSCRFFGRPLCSLDATHGVPWAGQFRLTLPTQNGNDFEDAAAPATATLSLGSVMQVRARFLVAHYKDVSEATASVPLTSPPHPMDSETPH